MSSQERRYHVVLFGATGFTGQLAAAYLAGAAASAGVRWAIAGRDLNKLTALREQLSAAYGKGAPDDVLQADSGAPDTLLAMAQETRVVMTTVGPYIRYGEPVVRACIDAGTDYVDITGEPEFVGLIRERYHDDATAACVRIVSCCGFDSIPHDLGALFTVRQLPAQVPIIIEGIVRAGGTFSGGTWNSTVDGMARARAYRRQRRRQRQRFVAPAEGRRVGSTPSRVRYRRDLRLWVAPLPTIDPMIVRRSARALAEYGPDFRYGHFVGIRKLRSLLFGAVAVGGMFLLAQFRPTANWLRRYRPSGEGPDEQQRNRGWFRVTFVGEGGGSKVVTTVSGGDPGYTETAKMISEAALCLALDRGLLPDRYGVLTPVEAMADPLLARLQAAGIRFERVEPVG